MTNKLQREAGTNEGGGNGEQKMSAEQAELLLEKHIGRNGCEVLRESISMTRGSLHLGITLAIQEAAQFTASAPDDQWTAPYQPTEKRGEFALQSQQPKASASAPSGGISDVLRFNKPWDLEDVLLMLTRGTELLLHKKSYDGPDYEEMEICVKAGREIMEAIATLPKGEVEQKDEIPVEKNNHEQN